jgi:hypothetical protein
MLLDQQKKDFSLAYIRAVASVAGYRTSRLESDDDSCDLTISAVGAGHLVATDAGTGSGAVGAAASISCRTGRHTSLEE